MEKDTIEMTPISEKKRKKSTKKKGKGEEKEEKSYESNPRKIITRMEDKEEEDDDDNDNAELTAVPSLDNEIDNLLKNDRTPFNEKLSLITDAELQQLKKKIDSEVFVTNQLQIVLSAFEQYHFTCAQVATLIQDFPYFEMKNQAVTKAFSTIVDKKEFKTLLFGQVFSDLERRVIIEKLEHAGPAHQ